MGPKLLGRLMGLTIFATSFVAANAGHQWTPVSGVSPSQAAPIAQTSETAAAQAQARFSRVFELLSLSPGATIQVRLTLPSDTQQTIWVTPMGRHDTGFLGQINAEQDGNSRAAKGDVILFSKDQVLDWHFAGSDGTIFGNFTVRERLAALPDSERGALPNPLSDSPYPANWF